MPSNEIDGNSVSVKPRPAARTIPVGAARDGSTRGAIHSRKMRLSQSGSKVRSARSGCDSVMTPSPVRALIAIKAGVLAPRLKFAQGTHDSPFSFAASCATAHSRSRGMVPPAAMSNADMSSRPWALIGWRQISTRRIYFPLEDGGLTSLAAAFLRKPDLMFPNRSGFDPCDRMMIYCCVKVIVLLAIQ